MKFEDRRKVFNRKDDNVALDFEGKRHYYQIKHVEYDMFDYLANNGNPIPSALPTNLVGPEPLPDLVPKYHNVLADVIIGVRPVPFEVSIGLIPTIIVQNKSCRIYLHDPEAQPRRYTPFARLEAFIADHITSPFDDPDESFARFWCMHNDEPALLFENGTLTFDPPANDITLQVVRFFIAQYILSDELQSKPDKFTPIPYLRTTIADFATREMVVGSTP